MINEIEFNRGQGGLGTPLPGEDHISGLLAYLADGNLPSGFTTSEREKQVASLEDAEALGFTKGSATNGVIWYHIDQFFKGNPKGILWIGLYDNTAIDYSKVEDLQVAADGKIRQMGVFDRTALGAGAAVSTLQTSATNLENLHQPLNIIYAADISGVADLTTLPDLSALTSKNVSVTIGQDGANEGKALFDSEGVSITDLGRLLGDISAAPVHISIAWIEQFNVVTSSEFDVPAFANGDLYKDNVSLEASIDPKRFIYLKKYTGRPGTYHNDSYTAALATNDFAFVERNRTIDKAIRQIRFFMLPNLSGPLTVDADTGKLDQVTIDKYTNDTNLALEQMEVDGELSGFQTLIDPNQDVLATSEIEITVELVPIGVARKIKINIGFTAKLS